MDNNGYLEYTEPVIAGKMTVSYNIGNFEFAWDSVYYNFSGSAQAIRLFDIDGDNDFDLLLCGDTKNNLYINENGKFTLSSFPGITDIFTVGGPIGDIDNNLLMDHYTYNYSSVYLFHNDGKSFTNLSNTWINTELDENYYYPIQFDDAVFSDLDNNGYLDCLRLSGDDKNRAFMNLGDFVFVNDTANPIKNATGFLYHSIASADLTGNGFPDMFIGQGDGYNTHIAYPNYLYLNQGSGNNYLKLKCLGSKSNLNAIGTTVKLKATINGKPQWQIRQITAKSTTYTQNGYDVLFGVDQSEQIDSLIIDWPMGEETILTDLATNNYYKIIEPLIRNTGDSVHCRNEYLKLSVAYDKNTRYNWYYNNSLMVNDTLNYLFPDSTGDYSCQIINPAYTFTTNNIHVTTYSVSKAENWFAGSDSAFCDGDSTLILATNYDQATYHWYINTSTYRSDTVGSLYIDKIGNFYHILENRYGCRDTSNVIVPTVFYKPYIGIQSEIGFCKGDSVMLSVQDNYLHYNWSNGDTTTNIVFYEGGDKQLHLTDTNLCSWDYSFNLKEYERPEINLGPDTTISNDGFVTLNSACNPEYDYYWSDGDNICSKTFSGFNLHQGVNIILLQASNTACFVYDTIKITYQKNTSTELHHSDNLSSVMVFPVPASGRLKIRFNNSVNMETDIRIEILNSTGQKIYANVIDRPNSLVNIDISGLKSGIYYLQIHSKNNLLYSMKLPVIK